MTEKSEQLPQIECSICHRPIPIFYGWNGGNNAAPVVYGGRCCNECNNAVVIPARIRRMQKGEGPY